MALSVVVVEGLFPIELEAEHILAVWNGPEGRPGHSVSSELLRQLESPLNFPPLRQAIVPGDRVVVAVGEDLPDSRSVLDPLVQLLIALGIERDHLTLITPSHRVKNIDDLVPEGVRCILHDRSDRESLAYLATTTNEHRVYLNRELVEADFVLSVGTVTEDPRMGKCGPWSVLYPDLADIEAGRTFQSPTGADFSQHTEEIKEIGWLLGNQFQIALIPGTRGLREIIAGESQSVRDAAIRRYEKSWTFACPHRADVVLVGIGEVATIEAAGYAFAKAAELVRRAGKIILLSSMKGEIGPAASRLLGEDRPGLASLRGAESEPDYTSARALVTAMEWADLYMLSGMEADLVESLGIMPLSNLAEANRLVRTGTEVAVLNNAQWTRVFVQEDDT